jgi:hypothetical protein
MKTLELSGGLGNQLFGLSALATYLGVDTDLRLNVYRLNAKVEERAGHDIRGYALEPFTISGSPVGSFFRITEERYRKPLPGEYSFRLLSQSKGYFLGGQFWGTPFSYQKELITQSQRFRILRGNFLNFEYIDRAQETIFDHLSLSVFSRNYSEILSHVLSERVTGIHIRGGDFIKTHATFAPPQSYYQKALEMSNGGSLFIFTDDLVYAKATLQEHLSKFEKIVFVNQDYDLSDAEQFMLIGMFKCFVLCASSFSAVAVRISSSKHKSIIAPHSLQKIYGGLHKSGWKWIC